MGKVIVQASMSLDGFIADTNDQVGPLFDWFDNGDVEFSGSDPSMVFHISRASADYLRTAWSNIAVDVIGRVCSIGPMDGTVDPQLAGQSSL